MGSIWGPWIGILWTLSLVVVSAQEHRVIRSQIQKMATWRVQLLADPLVAIATLCPDRKLPNPDTQEGGCFIRVMGPKDGTFQDLCRVAGHSDRFMSGGRDTDIRNLPQGPRWYQVQLVCALSFQKSLEKRPILTYRIKR